MLNIVSNIIFELTRMNRGIVLSNINAYAKVHGRSKFNIYEKAGSKFSHYIFELRKNLMPTGLSHEESWYEEF